MRVRQSQIILNRMTGDKKKENDTQEDTEEEPNSYVFKDTIETIPVQNNMPSIYCILHARFAFLLLIFQLFCVWLSRVLHAWTAR